VFDLRRTGRTQLSALGCDADIAEVAIGYMSKGIEGIYNLHRYNSEHRVWLTKLNDHYEALAKITIEKAQL